MRELAAETEVEEADVMFGAPAEAGADVKTQAAVHQADTAIELPVKAGRVRIGEPDRRAADDGVTFLEVVGWRHTDRYGCQSMYS